MKLKDVKMKSYPTCYVSNTIQSVIQCPDSYSYSALWFCHFILKPEYIQLGDADDES